MSSYLFIPASLLAAFFFYFYRQKASELREFKRIHGKLQDVSGFKGIVDVIAEELGRKGAEVKAFYRLNRASQQLETVDSFISLLVRNSVAKALMTMKPQKVSSNIEGDQDVVKLYGSDVFLVPINLKSENACWEAQECNRRDQCEFHGKRQGTCWLSGNKFCRDNEFGSYKEKISHCLTCKSFLPVGVFVIRTRNAERMHRFLEGTFGGSFRGSVLFDKAIYSATRDSLTNLLNKRSLLHNINLAFKLAHRHADFPVSLIMFDIDHFKKFNDSYGHQEGDHLLKELAGLVTSEVRVTDTVARYGGEEFSIILPHTDKEGAHGLAEKIRKSVEEHIFCDDKQITISMGVAACPSDDVSDTDDFIRKADAALYQSKTTRNSVSSYCYGMTVKGDTEKDRTKVPQKKVRKQAVKKNPDSAQGKPGNSDSHNKAADKAANAALGVSFTGHAASDERGEDMITWG